ncbi:MAG: flap endonuclease-1 [Candidatus Nitrosocaldus sp.]|nr:flap endonuclease-1 [Candidatus Nitrosocaldus sp.]MDW8275131.1 flap endonuclease-1 [Candidatus Nitrosocaldus sp.]
MGTDLKPLVKAREIRLENLAGKVIAVDAYNTLYQFLATIRGYTGEPLMDSHGRVTSHLSGLFYRNANLLSTGVKPVYVFDGRPPALKQAELESRRRSKEEARARYEQALEEGRLEDARKYAQATSMLRDYMIEGAKRLLTLMGIPYIDAPSEGEATAAHMTITGSAYATASQDYDSLLFGARRLVRNLAISGRRKLPNRNVYIDVNPEVIELDEMLRDLGISREALVDVAILIGTDFNPDGFKGIGAKKALQLIRRYGRLEDIDVEGLRDELKGIDYEAIRGIFLRPEVAEDVRIEFRDVDEQGIIGFLCDEHDFSRDRVSNTIKRLKESMRARSSSLEQWFT